MSANIIQAQYETLDSIAARFNARAEATTDMHSHIMRGFEALTQDGWEGKGVAAFSAEMHGEIFPAVQRMTHALQEAQAVTLEAKAILQQAEEEAQRLFGGEGAAGEGGRLIQAPGFIFSSPLTSIGLFGAVGFGATNMAVGAMASGAGWLWNSLSKIPLFEMERGADSKFNPGINFKSPFFKDQLIDEVLYTQNRDFLGVPFNEKLDFKGFGAEGGAGFGYSKDKGFFAGLYGDYYTAKLTGTRVIGNQDLGFTDQIEVEALSADGFVGYQNHSIGAKIGFNVISAEREIGMNVAGYNVGLSGEVGLKWEWGIQLGAETEVKLPFVSLGLSFGGAK